MLAEKFPAVWVFQGASKKTAWSRIFWVYCTIPPPPTAGPGPEVTRRHLERELEELRRAPTPSGKLYTVQTVTGGPLSLDSNWQRIATTLAQRQAGPGVLQFEDLEGLPPPAVAWGRAWACFATRVTVGSPEGECAFLHPSWICVFCDMVFCVCTASVSLCQSL